MNKDDGLNIDSFLPNANQLCTLNNFVIKGLNGHALVKIGLGLELFIPPRDTKTLYTQLATLMIDYYNHYKENLNYYKMPASNRHSKLNDKFIEQLQKKMSNIHLNASFESYIFDDIKDLGQINDASHWMATFYGKPFRENEIPIEESLFNRNGLSSVDAYMPVCNVDGSSNIEQLLKLTVKWCNECQPLFGTAGFSTIYSVGGAYNGLQYALPLLKRFPGLDHQSKTSFSVQTDDSQEYIRGVNWLTILGNPLIEKLGGFEHCKKTLEPDCHIEKYNGGVIIIASTLPQLGDIHRGIVPKGYKKVAAYTKPIRFQNYTFNYFYLPDGFSREERVEEILKWVNRFD